MPRTAAEWIAASTLPGWGNFPRARHRSFARKRRKVRCVTHATPSPSPTPLRTGEVPDSQGAATYRMRRSLRRRLDRGALPLRRPRADQAEMAELAGENVIDGECSAHSVSDQHAGLMPRGAAEIELHIPTAIYHGIERAVYDCSGHELNGLGICAGTVDRAP